MPIMVGLKAGIPLVLPITIIPSVWALVSCASLMMISSLAVRGLVSIRTETWKLLSIPLSGKLAHSDSIGNEGIIETGEIQVMSAGTGITHSEMNGSNADAVRFLQIWVIPNKMNVAPRYQQVHMSDIMRPNEFSQVLSPNADDAGVWIHQDAWFSMGDFDEGISRTYQLNDSNNGVYVFVISGEVVINDKVLSTRDGLGIWDIQRFMMDATLASRVLVMEVPLFM